MPTIPVKAAGWRIEPPVSVPMAQVAALAATTSRVDIGQMCTAMGYRNPMYLAKVAATADLISGGRVQMGIGGGWYEQT